MTTAKAAVIYEYGKPAEIQQLEYDDPADYEVGVRITACGVCRSDTHVGRGLFPLGVPIILGHEGVGVIEKVGKLVTRVKVGDKIVTEFPACGKCLPCLSGQSALCDTINMTGFRKGGEGRVFDKKGRKIIQLQAIGAFSEYILTHEDCCLKMDDDLDLAKIAIVSCRVPTGWGAVVNTAQAQPGSTALVIGLGGVGFNALQALKNAGAVVIIAADIHDKKKWAMEWGATHYIDASKQDVVKEVMKITGIGVNYAFDAIGSGEVQAQTVASIKKNGKAVWIGMTPLTQPSVAMNACHVTLYQKQILGTLMGGVSPCVTIPQLIKMYRAKKIKLEELVTKEYKLSQINEAWADMEAGKLICGVVRMG